MIDREKEFPREGAVTINQVAGFLNVTPRTIRNWWEQNPKFPRGRKIGRSTRWDAKEVRNWWRDQ